MSLVAARRNLVVRWFSDPAELDLHPIVMGPLAAPDGIQRIIRLDCAREAHVERFPCLRRLTRFVAHDEVRRVGSKLSTIGAKK